jgi:hypothetical protein
MTVTIVSGGEGTGKTSQLLKIAEEFAPTVWGVSELKDVERIVGLKSTTFHPEQLYQVYADGTELQGNVDPIKTLQFVRKWRDKIYTLKPLPKTIVIDGISELRDYAIDEWIINDNLKRGKNRQSIGEKNLSAWGEVNAEVKKILEPLINKALLNHVNLFMTAGVKEKYLDGDIVGYAPDYKAWMSRSVQCLIQLECSGERYDLKCTKEPVNPRWNVQNIPKETGLLTALRGHNLIEKAQPEYVLQYDYDGARLREYVKADNEADAEAKFYAKHPDAILVEVYK